MMFATFILVFLIVLLVTRALAAAFIVTATVVLSYMGGFGLSALIWQGLFKMDLYWLSLPISFLVLVAVGCDYNLLLLNRYKEEIGAGVQTGLIRTMGTSGKVAIVAALVFTATMFALTSSDVLNIGQAGSTTGFGLLLDMFVMRLLVVLPTARALGRWFWWPLKISGNARSSPARPPVPS